MELKSILVPTDFSDSSRAAVPHALEIARRFEADVTMLHVRTLFADDPNRPEFQFLDESRYITSLDRQMEDFCDDFMQKHPLKTEIIREVSAPEGILNFVEERKIDLVVMGTHGRSGLAHFFMGSAAEKVVRYAACPVLTVNDRQEEYRNSPRYQKILAAYDFSVHSQQAARRAREIASRFDAEFIVLHVIDQEVHPAFLQQWQISVERDLDELERNLQDSVKEALGPDGARGVENVVLSGRGEGRTSREICRYAREREVDLITLGTYGLSGVERLLLGSTTERVVRSAPCPVLTFHDVEE
jgi:nucleotide-binding universal stress UspA family protein